MSKAYAITVNCSNCGHQFDVEMPKGNDLEDSWNTGTRLRWYEYNGFKFKQRHSIKCPKCDSGDCYKDRKNWPWTEEPPND